MADAGQDAGTVHFREFQAGHFVRRHEHASFVPSPVNHGWTWDDPTINALLEQATQAVGELNAYSLIVPHVDLFIHMHVVKEANTSSRIEGTRTGMDEAIRPWEMVAPERRDDWQEVQNYVAAMNEAIADLEELPLSIRLLRQTHATLMQGVRGERKQPGELRRSQNWIGGSGPSDALFVPPPHEEVPALMSDLEKFWHNERIEVPRLIRIAISHYQFETIHPFLDGNGRIGRLLITLYLVNAGLLKKPTLYLSAHFEKHRGAYYDALMRVRESNDLAHWVRFFLTAVLETARQGKATFEAVLALRREVEASTLSLGKRAENARMLLEHLYRRPVVTPNEAAELLGVTHQTASALIRDFEALDILEKDVKIEKSQSYVFRRYLNLFAE